MEPRIVTGRRIRSLPGFWASLAGLTASPVRAWLYVFRRPLLLATVMLAGIAAVRIQISRPGADELPAATGTVEAVALLHIHRDKVLAGHGHSPTAGHTYRLVGHEADGVYYAVPISSEGPQTQPVFWMTLDRTTGAGAWGRVGTGAAGGWEGSDDVQ